ncbi:hypothetical protein [Clostridium sp. 1001275B_160808_H3]|uniref:hypothetical protein n=1 Tax=Clostridium sp. 1001275B_160808_H3 TaxID=2787110 RepID=UPI0018981F56|nr:hypothetical protein [Clostridium sp. 1001275B_160808_H3]
MNRQERRKRDREIDKDKDFVKKLSANESKRMNEIIDKITKDKAEQAINLIYGSFISVLVSEGCTFEEIRKVQILMTEFILDEKEKMKILEKENVDMTKLQKEVREFMKGLIAQGKNRKEVIEETVFKFPKATKNMINRIFGEIDDEKVLEDAAAYILEDNKNIKKAIEKEDAKKIAAEVARQLEKEVSIEDRITDVVKKAEAKESDTLEVLEEVVIKEVKLKGRNGVYEAKTGVGVALENEGYKLAFKDITELESFYDEFKKVFGRI